jgi:hypothetical protein
VTIYLAEALFNRALCLFEVGEDSEAIKDLKRAQGHKFTKEHGIIDFMLDSKDWEVCSSRV